MNEKQIQNKTLCVNTISKKLDDIQRHGPTPKIRSFCDSIRNVVIVASSSRGGSSVFAEMLRKCPELLHLRAEINPILHVSGLTYPTSKTGSDALNAKHLTLEVQSTLNRELDFECGNPHLGILTLSEIDEYALAITRRLILQWPSFNFSYESTKHWLLATFEILKNSFGWTKTEVRDPQFFWCIFLTQVRTDFPQINPYYYDLNPKLILKHFPDSSVPEGSPSSTLIEEPPFIIPVPLKQPTESDLAKKPFIIKTPSNVYRLDFFKALFPNATPWILHLTRNAPQSVNGLLDGWCHRGFFSHSFPGKLQISGYSDRFPKWGADWWNFDLPPNWENYTSRSLAEVCAFQWYSAHQATLEYQEKSPETNYLRIRSEDVLSPSDEIRRATAEKVGHWLNLNACTSLTKTMIQPIEPVMTTQHAPQQSKNNRWIDKSEEIIPVLKQRKVKEMIERLGYSTRQWGELAKSDHH